MSDSTRERLMDLLEALDGGDYADIADAILADLHPETALPDPNGGCVCTAHTQDAGGGYTEHLLEYEPACPEHSQHLYDPRLGEWIHRPDTEENAR
ncbi:hypothetical protein DEU38_103160 [Rhodococcus sp. AG1013]|uniref:hypothetical protein n=1 Tax=Rhodococcus sp. AG1013 TaxID=2183996 RepID=UPI000E0AC445|nr:hypothetical protein [Rhodococcus sp. AG1013]RDI32427.1 hypothetical protein DEU38_103160 [Rhodococcus sp. AG1013]